MNDHELHPETIDSVIRALDGARRAGWARAYASEELTTDLARQVLNLKRQVDSLTTEKFGLQWGLYWCLTGGSGGMKVVDFLESIVGGAGACSRFYLEQVSRLTREQIDRALDENPRTFIAWTNEEGVAMVSLPEVADA